MPGNFQLLPESVYSSWPTPNYIDPVRRTWMPAFCLVWQISSTAFLVPRMFLRAKKAAGRFGVDDVCLIAGWLFSIGFTVTAWLGAESVGMDRHTWDVPPTLWAGAALTGWVAQLLFALSTVATKLSVMLLYRRFVPNELAVRWSYAVYFALFATAAYGFGIFLTYCLICQPLEAYWLSYNFNYHKPYKCINGNALIVSSCVLSTLSDFYAVALPCALVRKYNPNIPRGQKIALNVMFGLGLIVTGVGVGRTYTFWQVSNASDTSWNGFELFAWALVEVHLSIICACAPSTRIFILQYVLGQASPSRFQRVDSFTTIQRANTRKLMDQSPVRTVDESDIGLNSRTSTADSYKTPRGTVNEIETLDDPLQEPSKNVRLSEKRVTTAEEYEMYAIAELSRHTRTFT